jgi:hypothetical protein
MIATLSVLISDGKLYDGHISPWPVAALVVIICRETKTENNDGRKYLDVGGIKTR